MDLERSSSDDNGRDTPKEGFELPLRTDTPGPMPKYIYSRDVLFDLSSNTMSKMRPSCLSKDYDTQEGLWDPERWFRSFDNSRGSSPMTVGDKKRPSELDRDYMSRRRPSDPKERLKEEKDGIVLSPQRRSFGTGCHVSTHVPIGRQISIPGQENTDKDRNSRRIGSGRIQIDRDREAPHQERDYRAIRDRFDRDDRRFDSSRPYSRREFEDRRDFRDRNHYNNNRNRRDSFRSREEEEPEWFTEGPTSQNDQVELHGFEKRRSKTPEKEEERWRPTEKPIEKPEKPRIQENLIEKSEKPRIEENQIQKPEQLKIEERKQEIVPHRNDLDQKLHEESVANVTDRNGSLETNEPSSPEEESNNSDSINVPSPHSNLFDFNEFFKIENLPGLNEGVSPTAEITGLRSRFSQWFASTSRDNSRRSSINEDFGYLNDLLGGSKSPIIPSPPPPSANNFSHQSIFSTSANSTFYDKPQHQSFDFATAQKNTIGPMLNALFQNNPADKPQRSSASNMSTQDAEMQLKALLFGRKGSTPSSSGTGSPAVASPLNLPGRVKTVAELEADMKPPPRTFTPQGAPIQHPMLGQQVRPQVAPQPVLHPHKEQTQEDEDLTAFNKLLSLMKAGAAAAVESPPKLTGTSPNLPPNLIRRNEQRSMSPGFTNQALPPSNQLQQVPGQSPLTPSEIAQNDFMQALLRNKEEQLQIRQQTLNQMRKNPHMINQSTPIAQQPPSSFQQQQVLNTQQPGGNPPSQSRPTADPIANFIKQNPTIITKPSTPTPPPQQPPVPPLNVPGVPPGQASVIGLMQNTPSPRATSPQLIHQALLAQPGSPRVPSPIMFSQQPPMHLSAPSPIHPSQISGKTTPVSMPTATNLSTTATIRPPVVPRVPSPQELIAHTQAIMQTALLKKQLEDQKERFIKKQQERGKSPNPAVPQGGKQGTSPLSPVPPRLPLQLSPGAVQQIPISMQQLPSSIQMPVSQTPHSIPHSRNQSSFPSQPTSAQQETTGYSTPMSQSVAVTSKPSVMATFTPTSVMRKMHSDKASEKEKQKVEGAEGETSNPPIKQLTKPDDGIMEDLRTDEPKKEDPKDMASPQSLPSSMLPHVSIMPTHMPNLNVPPPSLANQNVSFSRANSVDQSSSAVEQIAAIQAMMASDRMKAARPVIGQAVPSISAQTPGRPIVKGGIMTSAMTPPNQGPLQLNKMGTVLTPQLATAHLVKTDMQTSQQRPIVGSGGTPISTPNVDIGKLLQQRHVNISPNPHTRPPVNTPGIPIGIPITGRIPMQPHGTLPSNPVIVQQMMQGNLPQAAVRVNTLNQINHLNQMALQSQQRVLDPRLQNIRGVYTPPVSGISPRGLPNSSVMNRTLTPNTAGKPLFNGPVSPTYTNNNKPGEPNLMKWFGSDVLKTPLPHMPPLPAQGQRVMTVDEIERYQQAVSN